MPRLPHLFAVLACLLLAAPANSADEARLRRGDDPNWARPDFPDLDWERVPAEGLPMRTGPIWVRLRLVAPSAAEGDRQGRFYRWPRQARGGPVDSVFLTPAFSFDLFWDGHLLERNGVVGHSPDSEQPGTLNRLVRIPAELLGPGEHLVALRISSYHYNFPATHTGLELLMENFERRLIFEARRPVWPLVAVGGALLVAAVCAVFYFMVERRRAILLGSVLGLVLAVFYGLISLRWLFNLSYDWHCPRLTAITALMGVTSVLLPWMLIEQFEVPRLRAWLGALAPLLIAAWFSSPIYEVKALWLCRAMLVVSLLAVGWATWRRRPGAWFVLLGIAAGLLVVRTSRRAFLDPSFFLLFELLALFPLAALGVQLRSERRRAREAMLTTARLETELLKKNIQPHFLINTLATIMEVIEREPRSAIALIESLASEFRVLARISGETLVPLAQEIELCRAHLAVMSMRKDARCVLLAEGIDGSAMVPPALFHTLVENGLTHLRPRNGEYRFSLAESRAPGHVRYTFVAEGEPPPPAPAGSTPSREGTGLRYVRARLEESFAGRWSLVGEPTDTGWRTVIELRDRAMPPSSPAGPARVAALPAK